MRLQDDGQQQAFINFEKGYDLLEKLCTTFLAEFCITTKLVIKKGKAIPVTGREGP
jgi:hypothetical protein